MSKKFPILFPELLAHFELIKGSKSNNIETILGYRGKDEVVHRDDLVFEKK